MPAHGSARTRDRIQTAHEILLELKAQRRAWESGLGWAGRPAARDIGQRPGERLPSIAVLPFTDMSAAKDQEWFCDGIAEEILNALAPLNGLRVAARTSAFSFKGKSDDLRAADAAGHHEEAIVFARRAWDEREPTFILWARHFPQYRPLHSDPRFAAILREMNEPV